MRGATRAADVTNILNQKILRICPVLEGGSERTRIINELSVKKNYFFKVSEAALCNKSDPVMKTTQSE
jgi:hypothetical protein